LLASKIRHIATLLIDDRQVDSIEYLMAWRHVLSGPW